ncbi:MAG: helix-turn-helix domain-containing protein [Moraxella sp.]|nr:helix-turn-helix domain-containing protein [Moraxella sp.]
MTATPATKPKMAVKQIIMQKLLAGEILSPLTALQEFGCLSLPQRISELRARGEPIQGRMVTEPNGKRHNIYWIEAKDRENVYRELAG